LDDIELPDDSEDMMINLMKSKVIKVSKKVMVLLLALMLMFGVLSTAMPLYASANAFLEEPVIQSDNPADETLGEEDDHLIEDEPIPLGSGLNDTNGSWSIYLLIPIMAVASFGILFGVRVFVVKKRT